MTKTIKGYKIDFKTNTITVTKAFMKKAEQLNAPEFKTMMELRALGMEIVEKAAPKRKNTVHRATYKQMKTFISCITDADRYMAEFEVVRLASLKDANPYETVRNWFETTFPNHAGNKEITFFQVQQKSVYSSAAMCITRHRSTCYGTVSFPEIFHKAFSH